MPELLCGACRSRPRKLKSLVDGLPVYYDWCAVRRRLARIDSIEANIKGLRCPKCGEWVEAPVKEQDSGAIFPLPTNLESPPWHDLEPPFLCPSQTHWEAELLPDTADVRDITQ